MPQEDIEQRLKQVDQLIGECIEIADKEGLYFELSPPGMPSNTYYGEGGKDEEGWEFSTEGWEESWC